MHLIFSIVVAVIIVHLLITYPKQIGKFVVFIVFLIGALYLQDQSNHKDTTEATAAPAVESPDLAPIDTLRNCSKEAQSAPINPVSGLPVIVQQNVLFDYCMKRSGYKQRSELCHGYKITECFIKTEDK